MASHVLHKWFWCGLGVKVWQGDGRIDLEMGSRHRAQQREPLLRVCLVTRMSAHSHFDGSWIIPTHQIKNLVTDCQNHLIKH